ncbi:MAG: hypothetical protein ACT4NY_08670 [Pseudonocardiales bacterium]
MTAERVSVTAEQSTSLATLYGRAMDANLSLVDTFREGQMMFDA